MTYLTDRDVRRLTTAAVLDVYPYLDRQEENFQGRPLAELLTLLPAEGSKEYLAFRGTLEAALAQNPSLGELLLIDQSVLAGFSAKHVNACTFWDPASAIYICYRGTGDGKWVDNGEAYTRASSFMQRKAEEYFDSVAERYDLAHFPGETVISGHSKGGNNAQFVAFDSPYAPLIDACCSFDGQGLSDAATAMFREKYGAAEYETQLAKMTAVNGSNDPVNRLVVPRIPDAQTYLLDIPLETIADTHSLRSMLRGDQLLWSTDAAGRITHGEPGPIWRFVDEVSKQVALQPLKVQDDCAMGLMSLIELLEKGKLGTGDRKIASPLEWIGFFTQGAPLLLRDLLHTKEGKAALTAALQSAALSLLRPGQPAAAFR
ncbi:MAG: DUF2974 domain-containing protein [Oscillospiraceae bacterium]|nr:DUF2974 domain-containing protein [Oscillospiraceae bacterium]